MLVLTRKVGETVVVAHNGETLELQVVDVSRGEIRIGFSAPLSFQIRRSELPPLEMVGGRVNEVA